MIASMKLSPHERLLVESGINHYKVVGPGRVWLIAGQRALTKFTVGPLAHSLTLADIQTVEKIPVEITVRVLYQVNPDLLTETLLPSLPGLNEDGWHNAIQWQAEYLLRQLVADYAWRDLGRQRVQYRLERQLTQMLAERLQGVALTVSNVCLLKVLLPPHLQQTIVQAQQANIEAQGRAEVLMAYFNIFGQNLSQAMPHIIHWELLTMLQKQEQPHLLLTASDLSLEPAKPTTASQPFFQMGLPVAQTE